MRRKQLCRGDADNLRVSNFHFNLRTEKGAENLATLVTVGVPLLNLCVAGYLFVSALLAANDGGEMSVSTGWSLAACGSSGVLLATVMFWLASRRRRKEREESMRRAAAARRVLARPVVTGQMGPASVTVVVRRSGSAV
jgi:hypothetical protein